MPQPESFAVGDRVINVSRGHKKFGCEGTVKNSGFNTAYVVYDGDPHTKGQFFYRLKLIEADTSHIPEDWS